MAKSLSFPQHVAEAARRYRLALQIVGVALAVVGFLALRWLAPANLPAQICAASLGVSLVLFAQFFALLQKLQPEERRTLELAGLGGAGVCLAAALAAAGFHLVTRMPRGDSGGGSPNLSDGGAKSASTTQVAFAAEQPNRLVIRLPGPAKKWERAVVEVQKIWILSPDTAAPASVDWVGDSSSAILPGSKQAPYKVSAFVGDEAEVTLELQPDIPDALYETVDAVNGKGLFKFGKPPQDYVFLLRLELVDRRGKATPVGQVVYLADLKTAYKSPTTETNKEKLREIAELSFPKSRKLADLLAANVPGAGKP